MADYANHMSYTVDLNKPITKTIWHDLFVTTSKKAHRIELQLRRGTESINFDGDVTATLITYADMLTQEATGTSEDGKAVFVFPDSFYRQNGLFSVVIFINDGETRTPVFCGEGNMSVGETDTRYDPDGVVPSLSEVLAQIEAARAAANAANQAAGEANAAAEAANNAADTAFDAGAKVDQMTVSAVELNYDQQPTVTNELVDDHYHLTFGIPKGDPYTIKGHAYASLADLQADVKSPDVGDLYNVGLQPPYNIYRWTGSSWEDQGKLQGVKGDKGDKGDPGDPGQMGATPEKGVDYWTEEDKAEIVEEVIESTKGLTDDNLDLLWSNINHSTAFAAQVVSLPALADYKIIAIRFKGYVSFTEYSPLILYQTDDTRIIGTVVAATKENIFIRPVTINKSAQTVTFGNGSKNGDTMAYNDDNFAIPVEIYGVRWGGGGGASDETVEELAQSIEEVRAIANQKADALVEKSIGAIATTFAASPQPAICVVSRIASKDDGTAHSSITLKKYGKNLYPGATMSNNNSSKDYADYTFPEPLPPGTYTISLLAVSTDIEGTQCNAGFYTKVDGSNQSIGTCQFFRDVRDGETITLDRPLMMMRLYAGRSATTSAGDKATFSDIMIEVGKAMTEYEPYEVVTTTVDLPEPVYGGYYNWTTGEVVSELDADGNALEVPGRFAMSPHVIELDAGVNNFKSSTGNTELTYAVDLKAYIDRKFAEISWQIIEMG